MENIRTCISNIRNTNIVNKKKSKTIFYYRTKNHALKTSIVIFL